LSNRVKLEKILCDVLGKYPELGDYRIEAKYASLPDAYSQYKLTPRTKSVVIEVDEPLKRKRGSDALLRAAIASELSHLVKAKKLARFGLLGLEGALYNVCSSYRGHDERQADLITVSRGFGSDLLALLEYEENRGEDEEGETHEGLTAQELRDMLVKR
jgi:hypothetical protein